MTQIMTVGLDLAKSVFQVHAENHDGSPVVRRKLRRAKVIPFFTALPPCLIGMQARRRRPHNEVRNELCCEGDDDLMAKQGDRDRPNPRHCQSFELDALTERRSTDSIRARGKQYAASRGRIGDCKPNPLPTVKTICN